MRTQLISFFLFKPLDLSPSEAIIAQQPGSCCSAATCKKVASGSKILSLSIIQLSELPLVRSRLITRPKHCIVWLKTVYESYLHHSDLAKRFRLRAVLWYIASIFIDITHAEYNYVHNMYPRSRLQTFSFWCPRLPPDTSLRAKHCNYSDRVEHENYLKPFDSNLIIVRRLHLSRLYGSEITYCLVASKCGGPWINSRNGSLGFVDDRNYEVANCNFPRAHVV